MSGSIPQQLASSQGPSAFELLWERNRRLVQGLFWVLAAGVLAYYGFKYYAQKQVDAEWSKFAIATSLRDSYSPEKTDPALASGYEAIQTLLDGVRDTTNEKFDRALADASPAQVPYILWLQLNHAARTGDGDTAQKCADRLQQNYPNHPLCKSSDYPVQVRDPVKKTPEEKEKEKADPKSAPPEPKLVDAKSGSSIGLVLEQLKAAKEFVEPAAFKMPEIPADAPRYRITFKGEYGSFVIALMTAAAPKHCAKFEELATNKFWDGIKVNEISRPGKSRWVPRNYRFQFGYESTKTEENRTDWNTTSATKPENTVEEITSLSHFPGSIAATYRDGKSEVDRLFVCASDCALDDGTRMVFAYIVEGIENAKRVCEADFARAEDADLGSGLPAEDIVVESVTKL